MCHITRTFVIPNPIMGMPRYLQSVNILYMQSSISSNHSASTPGSSKDSKHELGKLSVLPVRLPLFIFKLAEEKSQ